MKAIVAPLKELDAFQEAKSCLGKEKGLFQLSGLVSSQKTHMMYALSDGFKYKIIACSSELRAKVCFDEYSALDERTYYYPAKDLLFFQADLRSKDILKARSEVLEAIYGGSEVTIVTSIEALMDTLVSKSFIESRIIRIKENDSLDLEKLTKDLVASGYERVEQIEGLGQFALRGGIIDIYPITAEEPVRIELWGDEIDSMRTFQVETQRSLENIGEVTVFPASDYYEERRNQSFLDYFAPEETAIFLDEPLRIVEKGEGLEQEFLEAQSRRVLEGVDVAESESLIFTTSQVIKKLNGYHCVGFYTLDTKKRGFKVVGSASVHGQNVNPYNRSFELLTKDLKRLKREGYQVLLLSASRSRAKRLAEDLRDYSLHSFYSEDLDQEIAAGEIMTSRGYVETGYEYPMLKFVVIAESDIFGKVRKKKKRKTYEGRKISNFQELQVGDYVVHENHGLGIYQGIEKIQVEKNAKDFMKIAYAKGGNLYIPATQLDLIQKYAGADAKKPKLNTLGTKEWGNTKKKVRGAVQEIAKELVELYAKRQEEKGFRYGKDTVWQQEFEELFPFEETEDQLHAIEDVKRDMESDKIMDRLICGDVGYGKTEIAVRAAFKAVQENKQVVYLVPTTILAQQHFKTFSQRMKDYPVRVDLLSRFRSAKEQKQTLTDLKKGLVDIVIGTHRLLSADVKYKDLGLLIVDEEQRFGVKHKERIKELKTNVEVITLSATPIPRTLHMSLIGIRDMSVLEEAPNERMPIQTYVMEHHNEMVREAIEREVARGGQVYYVYNKVEDIDQVTGKLQKLIPDVTVAYAHGQMRENKLEGIMLDFINGEIDVLVSTTIIETGLDIPNVNTMIIHDADKFGLSQLYQLRGRVGRSNRMAYAFLLYRRNKLLKEVAEKRLSAIREFTDLGSGFKIAMRDLEIRGAGNLLGASQHGNMEAVGYDLYCKMLNEAVRHLKGESSAPDFTTTVDISVDAFIPDTYIKSGNQKLDMYKRIATIENEKDKDDITDELIDRFGDLPKKVEVLIAVAMLKARAHEAYITSIEQKQDELKFTMKSDAPVDINRIADFVKNYHGKVIFRADSQPAFYYRSKGGNRQDKKPDPLIVAEEMVTGIKGLLEG
ncbi:transcription-repair coupling factor (superfamily II helicase) [Lachnospiraceae bacterium PFB1-21]